METKILIDVKEAASILLQGDPIAIPTETVYGLAAPVFMPETVRKIFEIKGRPQDNPLIVHISSLNQVQEVAESVSPDFYRLAEVFFPGPLTIVCQKKETVPSIVSANLATIGIRMPKHPLTLQLIDEIKMPLAAPSANLSGKPSSTSVAHVLEDFSGNIRAILDGGDCVYGLESTVLLLHPQPIILRPGAIKKEAIEEVIGKKVEEASHSTEKPLCPGMKYRHYSPKAKVFLFESMIELHQHLEKKPDIKRKVLVSLKPESLYESFREADRKNCEEIAIFLNDSLLSNAALMNRLLKAKS